MDMGWTDIFGVVTLIYFAMRFLQGCFKFSKLYFTKTTVDYKIFGEWAMVTGATDGIGKGIAKGLAKRGMNIVLISRNPTKLKHVADEIESTYSVKTKCITMDFSKSDALVDDQIKLSQYDIISDGINDLQVGILVNNVGMGAAGEFLRPFSAHPNENLRTGFKISDVIYCNDLSMAMVTALVLPQMLKRKRGLVINISSIAGAIIVPNSAIYASSKTFNDTFTLALNQEYKDKGIVFQSVQPGIVKTKLTTGADDGLFVYPECEVYTGNLLKSIGTEARITGYHFHELQRWLLTTLPERFVSFWLLKTLK